jgi:hypothetical protein
MEAGQVQFVKDITHSTPKESLRLKYYPDFNSSTFFSFTYQYKWRYSFTDDDQQGLLKECFFMMFIQLILSVIIVYSSVSSKKTTQVASFSV